MQLKAEDSSAAADLLSLLKQATEVHRTLLSNARRAGIEVPEEALLAGGASARRPDALQPLECDNYVAVDAEDWGDFEDEGALLGFSRGTMFMIQMCAVAPAKL